MKKENRIGEIRKNNKGSSMIIIEYKNTADITVLFPEHDYKTKTTYGVFKQGNILSPFEKTIYGVGYQGDKLNFKEGSEEERKYKQWTAMMQRCYDEKLSNKHETYKGCKVYYEWHNYQTFKKWYDENYYTVDDEKMDLDKDILYKQNKIYSPKTCVFVPHNINGLFVKCDASRGDLPIGVVLTKNLVNKYRARCQNTFSKEYVHIGVYPTTELAFNSYKQYKENHIKEVADYYREQIPDKLYNAMINYKVEITD